jgi:D-aminopeptidase
VLQVLGAPVGKELGRYAFRAVLDSAGQSDDGSDRSDKSDDSPSADGSIMIVVATDAPLSDRNLERVAARAVMGLGRTGSFASNGSGDYVLAFSTAESVRRRPPSGPGLPAPQVADLPNDDMSGLFAAAAEATEEAIYNSMFMATTVESRIGRSEAIPLDRVREVLRKYGISK